MHYRMRQSSLALLGIYIDYRGRWQVFCPWSSRGSVYCPAQIISASLMCFSSFMFHAIASQGVCVWGGGSPPHLEMALLGGSFGSQSLHGKETEKATFARKSHHGLGSFPWKHPGREAGSLKMKKAMFSSW